MRQLLQPDPRVISYRSWFILMYLPINRPPHPLVYPNHLAERSQLIQRTRSRSINDACARTVLSTLSYSLPGSCGRVVEGEALRLP